jgi:hypothetical protein
MEGAFLRSSGRGVMTSTETLASSSSLTALDVLLNMKQVEGTELDALLACFHNSVGQAAGNVQTFNKLQSVLHEVNREYFPATYSSLPEANVLANVVAAYYAPLIHGFSTMILDNVSSGTLPPVVLVPPRDTIPIAVSLKNMSRIKRVPITLLDPPINRNTSGVVNNQKDHFVGRDPLFDQLLQEEVVPHTKSGLVEAEFGIYSTTSLVVAKWLHTHQVETALAPVKFYGLGPNTSWVHALLSDGEEWVAEQEETAGLVDPYTIAGLMVLIDTLEELGMQNMYESVERLQHNAKGRVVPVVAPVSAVAQEIARATNAAVAHTAKQYRDVPVSFTKDLLLTVPQMVALAQEGYPTMLTGPIPPMNAPEAHFKDIRTSGLFNYPKLSLE